MSGMRRTFLDANDDDPKILRFEDLHSATDVRQHHAIRNELGMHPVRYEQRLSRLLATREALEAFPMVVKRRPRLADERRSRRLSRSI